MNRRSFFRKAFAAGAGLTAAVLGAKNLGGASASDLKEVADVMDDEFEDVSLDAKWGGWSNPPYTWVHQKAYPITVHSNLDRDGAHWTSSVEWSDGLTTEHKGFAKLWNGREPSLYTSPHSVFFSEDGHAWFDVDSSARLQYNCTAWTWRQARLWGGHAMSWSNTWGYDNGAYLRNDIFTDPPLDIFSTTIPGRVVTVEGGREVVTPYKAYVPGPSEAVLRVRDDGKGLEWVNRA